MRFTIVLLTGLALTATACDFITDDGQLDTFTYTEESHGQPVSAGIDAVGFRGEIHVMGHMNTPNPCHELRGKIETRGSEITLSITARPTGSQACVTVIGSFRYQAAIQGLRAGTWQLVVRHEYPGTGWETQELRTNVDVR